jgi:hypothetical protein
MISNSQKVWFSWFSFLFLLLLFSALPSQEKTTINYHEIFHKKKPLKLVEFEVIKELFKRYPIFKWELKVDSMKNFLFNHSKRLRLGLFLLVEDDTMGRRIVDGRAKWTIKIGKEKKMKLSLPNKFSILVNYTLNQETTINSPEIFYYLFCCSIFFY